MTIKELILFPAAKLRRVIALKTQIERLENKLKNVMGAAMPAPIGKIIKSRRTMSAAARKKISLAAKARWAKVHSAKSKSPAAKTPKKGKRTMSAAARRKIAAAAKARWAKVKAAGKKRL
jgi:hypothetical protein